MNMTKTEIEGFNYDSNGLLQYQPLFQLLDGYWSNLLAEMPEELRLRVKHAAPGWDHSERSVMCVEDFCHLSLRQKIIQLYDRKNDNTQEYETNIALNKFLHKKLKGMIDEVDSDKWGTNAMVLSDQVALPLKNFCGELGNHWPNPEPLLWRALFGFDQITLPGIMDKARVCENYNLIDKLEIISVEIYKVLNLDRWRVGSKIEQELLLEIEAGEQATPALAHKEQTVTENLTAKLVRDDRPHCMGKIDSERDVETSEQVTHFLLDNVAIEKPVPGKKFDALAAEYAQMLDENPQLTATLLMKKLLGNIGKPDTCILLSTGDGLQWEGFNGQPPSKLTLKQLEDRIYRWRRQNKIRG